MPPSLARQLVAAPRSRVAGRWRTRLRRRRRRAPEATRSVASRDPRARSDMVRRRRRGPRPRRRRRGARPARRTRAAGSRDRNVTASRARTHLRDSSPSARCAIGGGVARGPSSYDPDASRSAAVCRSGIGCASVAGIPTAIVWTDGRVERARAPPIARSRRAAREKGPRSYTSRRCVEMYRASGLEFEAVRAEEPVARFADLRDRVAGGR